MKLQALLIALAMAAGASAFAASGATPADSTASASKQTTTAQHKAKAKAKKAKRTIASTQRMGAPSAAPDTDLSARDRQSRIDDAYAKWKASQG